MTAYQRDRLGYFSFLLPSFVLIVGIVGLPFIGTLLAGFTEWSGLDQPLFVGFENYVKVFQDIRFWTSFGNNIAFIIAMTILPSIIALILALLIYEVVGKDVSPSLGAVFQLGFYFPQIVTIVVSSLAWRWIYSPNNGALNVALEMLGLSGLQRNWLGDPATALSAVMTMLVWYQTGYALVIFVSALQRLNAELYEAAQIDGASRLQIFLFVAIPQMLAELNVVILTTTVHALKVFDPVYAMTEGGPGFSTSVVSYYSYRHLFQTFQVGYGSAIANILTLVVLAITTIYVRQLMKNQEY